MPLLSCEQYETPRLPGWAGLDWVGLHCWAGLSCWALLAGQGLLAGWRAEVTCGPTGLGRAGPAGVLLDGYNRKGQGRAGLVGMAGFGWVLGGAVWALGCCW